MSRSLLRAVAPMLAVLTLGAVVGGCAPSCAAICGKLERCDLNPNVDKAECELSCEREYNVAVEQKLLDNNEPKEIFDAHRRCIGSNSCDEIADGACYDDALFPFELVP